MYTSTHKQGVVQAATKTARQPSTLQNRNDWSSGYHTASSGYGANPSIWVSNNVLQQRDWQGISPGIAKKPKSHGWSPQTIQDGAAPIQRLVHADAFSEFAEDQYTFQDDLINDSKETKAEGYDIGGQYTTVGFEEEFIDFKNPLIEGTDHVEIAESQKKWPIKDLPFILETDNGSVLELVTPPFLVETVPDRPIPRPSDVIKIDRLLRNFLNGLPAEGSLSDLLATIGQEIDSNMVIHQQLKLKVRSDKAKVAARQENLPRNADGIPLLTREQLANTTVHPFTKQKGGGAHGQANYATDAKTALALARMPSAAASNEVTVYRTIRDDIMVNLYNAMDDAHPPTEKLRFFLPAVAHTLAGSLAEPFILATQRFEIFGAEEAGLGDPNVENVIKKAHFGARSMVRGYAANLGSFVKDVNPIWIKDTLTNIGLGLGLSADEWSTVLHVIGGIADAPISEDSMTAMTEIGVNPGFVKVLAEEQAAPAIAYIQNSIRLLTRDIEMLQEGLDVTPINRDALGPASGTFAAHDLNALGVRQDTYILPSQSALPGFWQDKKLHVVESRRDIQSDMENLRQVANWTGEAWNAEMNQLSSGERNHLLNTDWFPQIQARATEVVATGDTASMQNIIGLFKACLEWEQLTSGDHVRLVNTDWFPQIQARATEVVATGDMESMRNIIRWFKDYLKWEKSKNIFKIRPVASTEKGAAFKSAAGKKGKSLKGAFNWKKNG